MVYEFVIDFDSLFEYVQTLSQKEAKTIPTPPREEGFITQDVEAVTGVIEDRDRPYIKSQAYNASAEIYDALSPALAKGFSFTPFGEGSVAFTVLQERVSENKVAVLETRVKMAMGSYILANWFSSYPQRADIAERYGALFQKEKDEVFRLLLKKYTERKYRFL